MKMILRKKYWPVHAGRGSRYFKTPQPVIISEVTRTINVFLKIGGHYKRKWVTPGWKEILHPTGAKTYTTPYWVNKMYTRYKQAHEEETK